MCDMWCTCRGTYVITRYNKDRSNPIRFRWCRNGSAFMHPLLQLSVLTFFGFTIYFRTTKSTELYSTDLWNIKTLLACDVLVFFSCFEPFEPYLRYLLFHWFTDLVSWKIWGEGILAGTSRQKSMGRCSETTFSKKMGPVMGREFPARTRILVVVLIAAKHFSRIQWMQLFFVALMWYWKRAIGLNHIYTTHNTNDTEWDVMRCVVQKIDCEAMCPTVP